MVVVAVGVAVVVVAVVVVMVVERVQYYLVRKNWLYLSVKPK